MRWLLESSLNARLLVIAVAATVLLTAIVRLADAPLEGFPNFGPVRVNVQTEALGLAPEEVENLITNPMEQEFFNGMPWLHEIRSDSLPGLSSVEMIFEPGTDSIRARQVVQERLTMTPALPQVSKPPFVIQPVATIGRVLIIGLESEDLSLVDVSVLARWKIRQRLLSTPGVANVAIWGFRDRQLQILVEPERLRQDGVSLEDIIRTAGNAMWSSPLTFVEASTPGTGGFIDTANQRIAVQHIQPIRTAEHLAQIIIEGAEQRSMTLGDVASIVEEHQLLIGDALVRGEPGLVLVVERFPRWSTTEVTRNVEQAIEAMRPGLSGIEMHTLYRPASYLASARGNLYAALGVGGVLLAALLFAFFHRWRPVLICLVATALSVAAAVLVLSALGAMLDVAVLAGLGLAIAVIVDDSVIDACNVERRLRESRDEGNGVSTGNVIVAAYMEMRAAMGWALSIVVVSLVPLFVVGGVPGAFLAPLATSYAIAVAVSMLVALSVTPALAVTLLAGRPARDRESPLAGWLARRYDALVRVAVQRPVPVAVLAAAVVAGGLAVVPQFRDAPLAPALVDRTLLVTLEGQPGLSLPKMRSLAAAAIVDLRSVAGVRRVGALIGRASTSDRVVNVNSGELWVHLDPSAEYSETVAAVTATMAKKYTELNPTVTTYGAQRFREVTEGTDDDLVVRVYGRDYDVLLEKAATVARSIDEVEGVVDPDVRPPDFEPTVEIEVIVAKAAAKGLKPGDIRRAAATMLAGITAGNLFEEQKIFDVVVWGEPGTRRTLDDIRELLIESPSGELVRLADVADVRIRQNPSVIKHDAVSRYVDVVAQVQGRGIDAVASAIREHLKRISFPSEHHVEVLGGAAERERAERELIGYVLGALLTAFFLLQACVRSTRVASLMFVSLLVPLATALLVAALRADDASVLSLSGGLAVLAMAVRGGIALVRRWQQLEQAERRGPHLDLVVEGCRDRFPAVFASTAATALLLAPLVVLGGVAGLEVLSALALVVIGGLAGTALLNLLVLPALYLRLAPGIAAGEVPEGEPQHGLG